MQNIVKVLADTLLVDLFQKESQGALSSESVNLAFHFIENNFLALNLILNIIYNIYVITFS